MKFKLTLSIFFFLSYLSLQAQENTDHNKSINTVISKLYAVISGPAGARDWDAFTSLMHPSAMMGTTGINAEGERIFRVFSPTDYVKNSGAFFEKNGFFEEELIRDVKTYGGVAQVYTSYRFRLEKNGPIQRRGVNCIQLAEEKGKWVITNIIWEAESDQLPLPDAMEGVGSELQLHGIFSDHMVLQRDRPIKIYGYGRPGSEVEITFGGNSKKSSVSDFGNFSITFPAMEAGGPHKIKVSGDKGFTIDDVLIGEVWLCGGQSNMEWTTYNSNNWEQEKMQANYPEIRLLTIPKELNNKKLNNISEIEWSTCSSESIQYFSAIGYFFGRKLHKELEIPIGLIDNAWGGTNIEGWMSQEGFSNLPSYKDKIKAYQSLDGKQNNQIVSLSKWSEAIENSDMGKNESWFSAESDKSGWADYNVPGAWEQNGYKGIDGVMWYSKKIKLPSEDAATLHLGKIDDSDQTYVNGKLVGENIDAYNKDREYKIPTGVLVKGENEIVVRISDTGGNGGFTSESEDLYLELGAEKYPLNGTWKMKNGTPDFSKKPVHLSPNAFPTNRFNTMVHPLTNFSIKGIIWYQGETNAWNKRAYAPLFKNMILDYRTKWQNDSLAFLFVQLANFMKENPTSIDTDWAQLRLAQADALDLPLTAMTSAIDLGVADDIHPRNKQDVALRLANNALNLCYGYNFTHQGPSVENISYDGGDIILTYRNIGKTLISKERQKLLRGFSFTTDLSNEKYTWATASIDAKNKVRIKLPSRLNIAGLRYAHSNNPGVLDLYNSAGLPAIPGEWILR